MAEDIKTENNWRFLQIIGVENGQWPSSLKLLPSLNTANERGERQGEVLGMVSLSVVSFSSYRSSASTNKTTSNFLLSPPLMV